jgi:ABC-2 type transport system permease protein
MLNTIYILWLRQIKRYARSKARIIGSLGQPILFLVALGFGFGPMYQASGQGNFIQFLAPGIIAMSIIFTAMYTGIEVIWDKQFGFLKETLVAPVSRFNIMLGRTLGGATVAFLQGALVLLISTFFGFSIESYIYLPIAFLFMFLIALFFTAFGTAIASVLEDMQGFQLIMSFIIMPTFFLSGSLFPLEGINRTLYYIIRVNPLTYGVDGLRQSLILEGSFNMGFDMLILFVLAFLAVFIGSRLFNRIQI